ncbi:aldehyde dehydrogenase [Brevibacillus reuszeri]|uniref:Aldehyde dehydrogenase n=1 Tax=Brevibacillus reuszeri TaxID=54915 RepID=A0A0K9YWC5_9BACL|nr:aldehyde dehydrogenase [Brevibacillus reuszeri]KNB72545.1 aldehyde dehydrogenase [Brevibacillus reuszeri]MED1860775.1 aldehyde dehydrogenase [Brevibacillus reuszeri]GED70444.1 aldehyde dehydrogenase [Brevibacillus reuszeri]
MQIATKKYQMFIDGEFVDSSSQETTLVINPATEEVISEVPKGTVEDVRRAIEAAERAQKGWAKLAPIERAAHLRAISKEIRENVDDLARTISEEMGKTLALAEVEVHFTADYIDYMAEWARRYEGEIVQSDRRNENIFVFKQPVGVIAGILPWNFPFFLIARKAAPALITGNTIVIKPSDESPNNAIEFAKIVEKAGLPKGVINIVTGSGRVLGNELSANPKVGMVSLTGSYAAGAAVMRAAAENITKVSLELGGKAPAIVMDDADIDLAVKSIVASRVINTGQVCNCAERVYVHERIAEEFIEKIVKAMEQTKYGNPLVDRDIDMGPLVNKGALESVDNQVKRAIAAGAKLLTGGKRAGDVGYYYEPTVLVNVTNEMEIMQEEIFGPVLPIATFSDLDEAIELANHCEYGLTSSIYTQNIDVAMRASNELQFGETYINRENFEAIQGFHAGWKKSGIGGADGKHGLEEYLQTHVVYLQYNQGKK